MLNKKILEKYLHAQIPLSQAMGVKIKYAAQDKVVLWAPLTENINHKKTAFGGSLHAVATLACWTLLYVNLLPIDKKLEIVITKSDTAYLAPVSSDFQAECLLPDLEVWHKFLKGVQSRGKARIELSAKICQENTVCMAYQGTFAALKAN